MQEITDTHTEQEFVSSVNAKNGRLSKRPGMENRWMEHNNFRENEGFSFGLDLTWKSSKILEISLGLDGLK
jgi:hypothetical protein